MVGEVDTGAGGQVDGMVNGTSLTLRPIARSGANGRETEICVTEVGRFAKNGRGRFSKEVLGHGCTRVAHCVC